MMKKKTLSGIVSSVLSISLLTSVSPVASFNLVFAEGDYGDYDVTITEDLTIQTTSAVTSDIIDGQVILDDLAKKENILFGEFQRERAVLNGKLAPDAKRLSLEEVNDIIDHCNSYDDIYSEIVRTQEYPDFIGGSGIINIEYWFDDNGSEKLLLLEQQKDIIYVQCDEKGKITNWQLLYPVENEIKFETYKTAMIGSFMIYNDIPNDILSTHLTIEQISKVISENKTFEDIYAEIQVLQSEPDVSYGSGMSIKEYWLNDQGDDFIIIFIEQKQIFRSDRSNNRTKLFDEKANGNDDTSSEDSTTVPNDSNDDATSTPLEELNRKGEILFGEFQREKAVLLGEYDANSPRLTLDKAEQYISELGSYDEFYKKLSTVQAYPDFIGGSGIINIEYWFDDNGSEKLLLLEQQKDIIYVQCDEKGKITNWQLLYPVENEIKFETYKTAMIGSFMIYNDVDATGDVNADGSFNISDVVLLQKWLLAVPNTELASWKAADFSKDNKLDVFDLCLMKRALIEGMDK